MSRDTCKASAERRQASCGRFCRASAESADKNWLPLVDALRTLLHAPGPDMVETFGPFSIVGGLGGEAGQTDLTTVRYASEGGL